MYHYHLEVPVGCCWRSGVFSACWHHQRDPEFPPCRWRRGQCSPASGCWAPWCLQSPSWPLCCQHLQPSRRRWVEGGWNSSPWIQRSHQRQLRCHHCHPQGQIWIWSEWSEAGHLLNLNHLQTPPGMQNKNRSHSDILTHIQMTALWKYCWWKKKMLKLCNPIFIKYIFVHLGKQQQQTNTLLLDHSMDEIIISHNNNKENRNWEMPVWFYFTSWTFCVCVLFVHIVHPHHWILQSKTSPHNGVGEWGVGGE